jgi:hypothetical protein
VCDIKINDRGIELGTCSLQTKEILLQSDLRTRISQHAHLVTYSTGAVVDPPYPYPYCISIERDQMDRGDVGTPVCFFVFMDGFWCAPPGVIF